MKKIGFTGFLILALCLSLAGCGKEAAGEVEIFLSQDTVTLLEGQEAAAGSTLYISLERTSGPTLCQAELLCKVGDGNWFSLGTGELALNRAPIRFSIPETCRIQLQVEKLQGRDGYVTLGLGG